MRKILVFGKNGRLTKRIRVAGSSRAKKPPIIEASFEHAVNVPLQEFFAKDDREFFKTLQSIYSRCGKSCGFGHYGDVISLVEIDCAGGVRQCIVSSIDQLAFPKGVMAVDFLPFFIDKNGQELFVGITLGKKGPDYGKPALIGGHIDHSKGYFESAAEAVIHEAKEEALIKLKPNRFINDDLGEEPIAQSAYVKWNIPGSVKAIRLDYLGSFRTEENKPGEKKKRASWENRKRVDWTFAYYSVIRVDVELTEELLRKWFKAGSDAKDLLIIPAGANDLVPEFAHSHHRKIYIKARAVKNHKIRSLS